MKKLIRKIEKLMVAATFAEAGEHETAREIMKEEIAKAASSFGLPPGLL